ncbi:MAG: hypothetical protein ACI8UQ_002049, partial [Bacteroidia bacterium]
MNRNKLSKLKDDEHLIERTGLKTPTFCRDSVVSSSLPVGRHGANTLELMCRELNNG